MYKNSELCATVKSFNFFFFGAICGVENPLLSFGGSYLFSQFGSTALENNLYIVHNYKVQISLLFKNKK